MKFRLGARSRVAAGIAIALSSGQAYASCPSFPTSNVSAWICATTSNHGDGVAIQVLGGYSTVSAAGVTSTFGGNGDVVLGGSAFRAIGVPGQISAKEFEPVSNSYGSGQESSSAGLGDEVHSFSTIIPFSNGNAVVSQIRLEKNAVVPNLHVTATGTASSATGAITVSSGAQALFSDIVSVTQTQLDAASAIVGHSLSSEYVTFSYTIHGSVSAGPLSQANTAFGEGDGTFLLEAQNVNDPSQESGDGGTLTKGPVLPNDGLLGETFTVKARLAPGDNVMIQADLSVDGTAVGAYGLDGSYNVNLSDTAQFDGVAFYADAGLTEPLPNLQLGSEFGFDYLPTDAVFSDAANAVPEPSTWVMLLAGFGGLGAAALRRGRTDRRVPHAGPAKA